MEILMTHEEMGHALVRMEYYFKTDWYVAIHPMVETFNNITSCFDYSQPTIWPFVSNSASSF